MEQIIVILAQLQDVVSAINLIRKCGFLQWQYQSPLEEKKSGLGLATVLLISFHFIIEQIIISLINQCLF